MFFVFASISLETNHVINYELTMLPNKSIYHITYVVNEIYNSIARLILIYLILNVHNQNTHSSRANRPQSAAPYFWIQRKPLTCRFLMARGTILQQLPDALRLQQLSKKENNVNHPPPTHSHVAPKKRLRNSHSDPASSTSSWWRRWANSRSSPSSRRCSTLPRKGAGKSSKY